ncbi:hypothetical protein [Mesorhizobium sp. ISC15]|uniref:hypothetical protein n=1 Tax=Mesorhizobium sp. ISC15 TaxID=3076429 RepID=UPI00301DA97F
MAETLVHTMAIIYASDPPSRQRIADAYRDAQSLICAIAKDGSARPRVVACLERYEAYRQAGDTAAAGWMLAAVTERLNERNLHDWKKLKRVVDKALLLLPSSGATALH